MQKFLFLNDRFIPFHLTIYALVQFVQIFLMMSDLPMGYLSCSVTLNASQRSLTIYALVQINLFKFC